MERRRTLFVVALDMTFLGLGAGTQAGDTTFAALEALNFAVGREAEPRHTPFTIVGTFSFSFSQTLQPKPSASNQFTHKNTSLDTFFFLFINIITTNATPRGGDPPAPACYRVSPTALTALCTQRSTGDTTTAVVWFLYDTSPVCARNNIPVLQRQSAILHLLPLLVIPTCATRFPTGTIAGTSTTQPVLKRDRTTTGTL